MVERDIDFEEFDLVVDFLTPDEELIASQSGGYIPLPDEGDTITLAEYTMEPTVDAEMEREYDDYHVESVELHYVSVGVDGDLDVEGTLTVAAVTVTELEGDASITGEDA